MSSRESVLESARNYFRAKAPTAFVPGHTYIPASGKVVDEDDLAHLVEASLDLWLTAGRFAGKLEAQIATRLNCKWALLTSSGSSANLLAFAALTSPGLGERRLRAGDEVIAVAAAFPTTVTPILQYGCIPVFVDIDIGTYNVNLQQLEAALSPKTRAVMLAHALGNPFAVTEIAAFCRKHKLFLIEDTCDALGATVNGQPVGSFGDLATLSFYPAHQITTGEGGAIVGTSPLLRQAALSLRDWGRDCWCEPGEDGACGRRFHWQLGDLPSGYDHKYIYSHLGYNLRMTDLQAAIGLSQIQKLDLFIEKRRENHARFTSGFLALGLDEYFHLPTHAANANPSWFGYMLTLRNPQAQVDLRVRVVRFLEEHKVGTRQLFAGNVLRQPAFKEVRESGQVRVSSELVNTDTVLCNGFWIGVWPGIGEHERNYILEVFARLKKEMLAG